MEKEASGNLHVIRNLAVGTGLGITDAANVVTVSFTGDSDTITAVSYTHLTLPTKRIV